MIIRRLTPGDAIEYRHLMLEAYERHPDAFADHAARFLMDREPREALRWAVHNLDVRQTSDAYDLALSAALRVGDRRARCELARRADAVARRTVRLGVLVSDALAVCGPES